MRKTFHWIKTILIPAVRAIFQIPKEKKIIEKRKLRSFTKRSVNGRRRLWSICSRFKTGRHCQNKRVANKVRRRCSIAPLKEGAKRRKGGIPFELCPTQERQGYRLNKRDKTRAITVSRTNAVAMIAFYVPPPLFLPFFLLFHLSSNYFSFSNSSSHRIRDIRS